MKKPVVRAVITVIVITAFVFFSCAGNSIDGLLDELDKLVDDLIEYVQEDARLSNSSADSDPAKMLARLATVQKEVKKFSNKIDAIGEKLGKYEDDMTPEQTERFMRIMFRMAEVSY